jgi:hypothetical protein
MTLTYFSVFPIILYSNTQVRDISRRVKLLPSELQQSQLYVPYDVPGGIRSDVLAEQYYSDQDADWLIYICNGIIDPYFGWYLDDDNFNSYLIEKYGDLETPQQKVIYYQTNWADDDTAATPDFYNALPVSSQKYYQPVWGAGNAIIYYTRRPEDLFMNTNQIWNLEVANSQNFAIGDVVYSTNSSGYQEGKSEIVNINQELVTINNIVNNFSIGSTINPLSNTLVTTTITSVEVLQINIPLTEAVFWEPVSYWDWEVEMNESKKSIALMDKNYLNQAAKAIKTAINNPSYQ